MNVEWIQTLYAYNQWANQRVWRSSMRLTTGEFQQNLGIGVGSVHGQIVHIMSLEWLWIRRLQGQPPSTMLRTNDYCTRASIRARWDAVDHYVDAYIKQLTDEKLNQSVTYKTAEDREYTDATIGILLHIVNASTEARALALTMLNQLGAPTLDTDMILFLRETAPQSTPTTEDDD